MGRRWSPIPRGAAACCSPVPRTPHSAPRKRGIAGRLRDQRPTEQIKESIGRYRSRSTRQDWGNQERGKRMIDEKRWDLVAVDDVLPLALALVRRPAVAALPHPGGHRLPQRPATPRHREVALELGPDRDEILRLLLAPLRHLLLLHPQPRLRRLRYPCAAARVHHLRRRRRVYLQWDSRHHRHPPDVATVTTSSSSVHHLIPPLRKPQPCYFSSLSLTTYRSFLSHLYFLRLLPL